MKKKLQIPFDTKGNMFEYNRSEREMVHKDNYEFNAKLKIIGYQRSRSSVQILLKNIETKEVYTMFIKEFYNLICKAKPDSNWTVEGKWTFIKRGQSFSVSIIE